jgi:carbon monoxide dehydrogenase subunit G
MSQNTYSVTIDRPVEAVFAFMDDVSRESEWQPAIRSARAEPEGPTAVGTKKHYVSEFMGREVKNTYVTTVFEKNRRVVYETTPQSTVQATASFTWESTGRGTLVTMSVQGEPKGVLRLVPRGVLDRVYQKEIQETLTRLKSCLESAG